MALNLQEDIQKLLQHLPTVDFNRFIVDPEESLKWISIWKRIVVHLRGKAFEVNDSAICLIRNTSHDQMILAQSMIKIKYDTTQKMEQLAKALSDIRIHREETSRRTRKRDDIDDTNQTADTCLKPNSAVELLEEADEPLRDWYVCHLEHPFPEREEKQDLATATGYTIGQLNTWFTNMRRRSGYTEYLRKFAGGNKNKFQEMIKVCEGGEGHEEIKEAVEDMKKYVARRPRGKVGEWLMNLIGEEQAIETNPRKKRRVDRDASDGLERLKPEQTLAPPDPFRAPSPETLSTPLAKEATFYKKVGRPKKIKTYTFSIGSSGDAAATPSNIRKRRPLSSPLRTSPLRTVSTNSTSSLETVDSALRSVSASSTAGSSSTNISSDLNFTFPAYNVNAPPLPTLPAVEPPTVILTPPAPSLTQLPSVTPLQYPPQQTLYKFGATENSQFMFNPSLPHTVQVAHYYHPTMPYSSYPSQLVYPSPPQAVSNLQTLQHYLPYRTSEMRFADGFGTTKRGISEVGGAVVDERAYKLPRFEDV